MRVFLQSVRTRKRLSLLLFFFCILSESVSQAQLTPSLHLLFLADVTDKDVGAGVKQDIIKVDLHYRKVTNVLGYSYRPKVFKEGEFNRLAVENYLSSLFTTKDDVIVVVYSGHGKSKGSPTDYPQMKLTDGLWHLEEVWEYILKKNIRFCLVLGNCCSTPDNSGSPIEQHNYSSSSLEEAAFYKAIYLSSPYRGLLLSSSRVPDFAFTEPQSGSFFIRAFVGIMTTAPYYTVKEDASKWESLLYRITEETNYLLDLSRVGIYQDPHWKYKAR